MLCLAPREGYIVPFPIVHPHMSSGGRGDGALYCPLLPDYVILEESSGGTPDALALTTLPRYGIHR